MKTRIARPWIDVDFGRRMRTLGWALNAPGFGHAEQVHWREVRNADLPERFEVAPWLAEELQRTSRPGPAFLTSRDVSAAVERQAVVEDAAAHTVATVGLSNAERIGHRGAPLEIGTINILAVLDRPLSDGAMIEALSLAAEARTAAVMEVGLELSAGRATGTGTDCIIVAAPPGAGIHSGKHTAIGEALGRAVYDAVLAGATDWMAEMGLGPQSEG